MWSLLVRNPVGFTEVVWPDDIGNAFSAPDVSKRVGMKNTGMLIASKFNAVVPQRDVR